MPRYSLDPRKLTARFDSTCHKCGQRLRKGDDIAYWPNGRKAYCWPCGEQPLREAQALMHDEDYG